jgi:hypothetical protein
MSKTKRQLEAKNIGLEVENFNLKYPVGYPVRYWTGVREGEGKVGTVRCSAESLGQHTAVVWLNECSSCIALSHIEPFNRRQNPR